MPRSTMLMFVLAAIVFALAGMLAIAVVRFAAAVRRLSRVDRAGHETMLMADAVQDAVLRLRSEERAMKARAEESERLSSEIIGSMTSGLLLVDDQRRVRTLNPAGVQLLWGSDPARAKTAPMVPATLGEVLAAAPALADVVEESLASGKPIVRRSLRLENGGSTATHLGVTVSPIRSVPASGFSCPVIIRNSVVLPAPFGPMTPTIPPRGSVKLRSSIRSRSPYAFRTPRASTTMSPRRGPGGMKIST